MNGILGNARNRIGNIVCAVWKGIPYARTYVVPANPKTVAQQANRTRFKTVSELAIAFLAPVIQKFWNSKAKGMSGFNYFIFKNKPGQLPIPPLKNTVLCEGTLEPLSDMIIHYDSVSGLASAEWNALCLGNGLATDKVVMCVYDSAHRVGFVADSGVTRADAFIQLGIGYGRNTDFLTVWLFAYDEARALQSNSISEDTFTA